MDLLDKRNFVIWYICSAAKWDTWEGILL
jgi:hypothetical protein